jgi:hypothetical protein
MSRLVNALRKYHHSFDGMEPYPGGRMLEAVPAALLAGLGAYAFWSGPAVEPKMPTTAKQIALTQPNGRYDHATRGFMVTRRQFDAGVDCGGTDPWLASKQIERPIVVKKMAEQVIFSCQDSERLEREYGPRPKFGTTPLRPTPES